jgi:F420-0:gamma-glutamyl ligase
MTSPSELDIANFAENLIQQEAQKTPQQRKLEEARSAGASDWRDEYMKDVVISPELVGKICEGNASLADFTKKQAKKQEVVEQVEEKPRGLEDLVSELTDVITKAKTLMKEITTCGALGVNLGGPVKPVKKKKKKKKAAPKYESIQRQVERIINAQVDQRS